MKKALGIFIVLILGISLVVPMSLVEAKSNSKVNKSVVISINKLNDKSLPKEITNLIIKAAEDDLNKCTMNGPYKIESIVKAGKNATTISDAIQCYNWSSIPDKNIKIITKKATLSTSSFLNRWMEVKSNSEFKIEAKYTTNKCKDPYKCLEITFREK